METMLVICFAVGGVYVLGHHVLPWVRRQARHQNKYVRGYRFAYRSMKVRMETPRSLRMLIDESRMFGTYDDFDRGIEEYLRRHRIRYLNLCATLMIAPDPAYDDYIQSSVP